MSILCNEAGEVFDGLSREEACIGDTAEAKRGWAAEHRKVRDIEAETARRIAEMMRASAARIRANGGDDDTSIAIALDVEIDAIEHGEWKK